MSVGVCPHVSLYSSVYLSSYVVCHVAMTLV